MTVGDDRLHTGQKIHKKPLMQNSEIVSGYVEATLYPGACPVNKIEREKSRSGAFLSNHLCPHHVSDEQP